MKKKKKIIDMTKKTSLWSFRECGGTFPYPFCATKEEVIEWAKEKFYFECLDEGLTGFETKQIFIGLFKETDAGLVLDHEENIQIEIEVENECEESHWSYISG